MREIWHEFKYITKVFFKTSGYFFWSLIFPLILLTLFYLAFSGMQSEDMQLSENKIKVAVENKRIQPILESIDILEVKDSENKTQALKEDKLEGYFDEDMNLTIRKDTIRTKILQSVGDTTKQIAFLYQHGYPISDFKNYDYHISDFGNSTNMIYISYYSLVAMQSVYSYFNIMSYIDMTLANLSTSGIRSEMGAMKKWKKMTAGYLLSFLLNGLCNASLILSAQFLFGLPLIYDPLRTVIIISAANIFGLGIGSVIGVSTKMSSQAKTSVGISLILALSAVSGLWGDGLKIFIDLKLPLFNELNPMSIISRELYRVNALQMYTEFQKDVIILCSIGIILIMVALIRIKRRKYGELKSFS